jgi:hypothetical protein
MAGSPDQSGEILFIRRLCSRFFFLFPLFFFNLFLYFCFPFLFFIKTSGAVDLSIFQSYIIYICTLCFLI